jgi:beta-mannosidase
MSLTLILLAVVHVRSQSKVNVRAKIRMPLHSGWQFREAGKDKWYPATVPGSVHTDLLKNKLIDDPFYRNNEQKLQWIGKTDWEYQTTFTVKPELLSREHLELVFEGLDTYANVFLNDQHLVDADNMFRTWRVDCKHALRLGVNRLRIRFRSPINEILPVMAKMNYQLPSPNDQGEKTYPYTRKAAYQFGWDWGPRFVTSGIWKAVRIEAWDKLRIADLHIVQEQVGVDIAKLKADVEVVATADSEATLIVDDGATKTVVARKQVKLIPGTNNLSLAFSIPHPLLWWPNGLGSHPLYNFRARVLFNGSSLDQLSTRTGLRALELRQEVDQQGKSFEFIINAVPVFAKGGNWIPADSFPSRVSRAQYRQLLESVRDTNMNMLRVWGGGIYESNDFYELCDEMGILIWHDFMFAGSMYPGSQEFLDNVRQEAIDNVKRLRNHPSIVIWAGNNEIEAGWMNWGWKKNLPASLWEDYQKIFHGVLPEVCAALDPSRPYWPSSPHGGLADDPNSLRSGDTHFWGVWHAAEPFANYERQTPRFMSEFGFQSFPQIDTVNSYTIPSDRDIQSPVMLAHQKHPRGNQLIREYMLREYSEPKDFESFLYVSQVLQAEGIKIGAEHMRRIMPHNMGSLYWQIDDCWPVASWSSIDYYGRWKALQFYARRFYTNLLVSPHMDGPNLDFYVVSDLIKPTQAQMNVSLIDFYGQVLMNTNKSVTITALHSQSYLSIPVSSLLSGKDTKRILLLCELLVDGKPVSSNEYFFAPYKNLIMPTPRITTDIVPAKGAFKVVLSTDKFARAVYLSLPDHDGVFSDNYFDLLPGRKAEVEYRTSSGMSPDQFRNQIKIRSLVDAF